MIRVGIIGCGSITKFRHGPEYDANPTVEIAGFFDYNQDRASEMRNKYGGKVYDSIDAMLKEKTIDAVSVCTSNNSHAAVAIAALEAGKHVLCEKPMATCVEDAARMCEVARSTGKHLMVGHNQRFIPAHRKAREILSSGEMGKILSFQTTFSHQGPEAWSSDKGAGTWFFKKSDAFMGAIGDLGIHKADLVRWLIKDEISEVSAYIRTLDKRGPDGRMIEVDDNAVCILHSQGGIVGTLTASWTNYGDEVNSTTLYCSEGRMRIFDHPEYSLEIQRKNGERIYYKIGDIQTNSRQTNSGVIDSFADCIENGNCPEIRGEEGLEVLRIIFGLLESSQSGRSVKLR